MKPMSAADRALLEILKRSSDDVRRLNADLVSIGAKGRKTPQNAATAFQGHYSNEDAMQIALFRLIDAAVAEYPEMAFVYHVPNGGYRSKATAGRLKAMGVRRGPCDVQLDVARGGYHGLRIELKMPGNKPRAEQAAWLEQLRRENYLVRVHHAPDTAFQTIIDYLEGKLCLF